MASNESVFLTFHGILHIDSAFIQCTYLVHWHISHCDTSKGLINSMHSGLAYLKSWECRFLKFHNADSKALWSTSYFILDLHYIFLYNKVNFSFLIVQWYQKKKIGLGNSRRQTGDCLRKRKIEISLIKVLELGEIILEKRRNKILKATFNIQKGKTKARPTVYWDRTLKRGEYFSN